MIEQLILFSTLLVHGTKTLKRYLKYFQQEGYIEKRYLEWIWNSRSFEKRGSSVLLIASFFQGIISVSLCLLLLGYNFFLKDPCKQGKLPLKMTKRAGRIYYLSVAIWSCIVLINFSFFNSYFFALGSLLILPLLLSFSNRLLAPIEKKIQVNLREEARKKIHNVAPYVVGITGSYGKTSTKDALGHILNVTLGKTFWPEKGINTEMGITRSIRESLTSGAQYAVIEMGAYTRGSISNLCRLTPPRSGIITAVGECHLERFGSVENLFLAKSELAQSIPTDGILVVCGDDKGARKIGESNPKKHNLYYGFNEEAGYLDCIGRKITGNLTGSIVEFSWKGKSYRMKTHLFGLAANLNLLGAFTLAVSLGAHPKAVIYAISKIKPVENRLVVEKSSGVTYLRDAYNSNPMGFSSALDVLKSLDVKKRILMTPGMIELGSEQFTHNENLGKKAGQVCDLAIVVGDTNQNALKSGLVFSGMGGKEMIFVESRAAAFRVLSDVAKEGDAVLIENDLPDLYELEEKF